MADSLLTYDASATAAKTTTITNFYKTINTLTADATPDGAADYIPTYDASASGGKKVLIQNLAATQAQQETGSAITNFVTPGRQQYHQSAAKGWGMYDQSSGTASLSSPSYNVSSITDGATGVATVNWTTAFSTAVYSFVGFARATILNSSNILCQNTSQSKSTTAQPVTIRVTSTDAAADAADVAFAAFGDQ